MKKLIFTIISTAFISTLYAQSLQKVETITSEQKTVLILEMCKKKMGTENFNFIKDVFKDETILIMKCKEALSK